MHIFYQKSWLTVHISATSSENLFMPYAHPHSLISAVVVPCLDSIISILAKFKFSRLWLTSFAEQAGLSLTKSQTPKTGFLMIWLILFRTATCSYKKWIIIVEWILTKKFPVIYQNKFIRTFHAGVVRIEKSVQGSLLASQGFTEQR